MNIFRTVERLQVGDDCAGRGRRPQPFHHLGQVQRKLNQGRSGNDQSDRQDQDLQAGRLRQRIRRQVAKEGPIPASKTVARGTGGRLRRGQVLRVLYAWAQGRSLPKQEVNQGIK